MGQSEVEGENVYVLCFRILILMFRVFTFEVGGTIWLRGEIILQMGGNKFILPSKEIYSHTLMLKSQTK